jgi:beta-lactamase regulating signal transducer with metallopeptidase domain
LPLGHKRLPPKWAYALWLLVVVRLLMPVVPASPWSVFNLKPDWPGAR